jgi:hypothetical protein
METTVGRLVSFLLSMALAGAAAFMMQRIAYDDWGLSRGEIRALAVVAAILIGALLATEYLGQKLRKPK